MCLQRGRVSAVNLVSPPPATNTRLKLSPLASIRWSDGRILIFTPSHRIISAVDARILTVLPRFCVPRRWRSSPRNCARSAGVPQRSRDAVERTRVLIEEDARRQRAGPDVTTETTCLRWLRRLRSSVARCTHDTGSISGAGTCVGSRAGRGAASRTGSDTCRFASRRSSRARPTI